MLEFMDNPALKVGWMFQQDLPYNGTICLC